jgi:hypothetical protein
VTTVLVESILDFFSKMMLSTLISCRAILYWLGLVPLGPTGGLDPSLSVSASAIKSQVTTKISLLLTFLWFLQTLDFEHVVNGFFGT